MAEIKDISLVCCSLHCCSAENVVPINAMVMSLRAFNGSLA